MTPSRPLPANHLRVDALVALALALGGCLLAWLSNEAEATYFETPLWKQLLGTALLAVPLVWRRRHPIAMMLLQSAIYFTAVYVTGLDLYISQIMLFLGFYSVGAWASNRDLALYTRALNVAAMAVSLVVGVLLGINDGGMAPEMMSARAFASAMAIITVINAVFFGGAWVFGDRAWAQALERQQLEAATDEIRALQQELVDNAIETERMRIARELHDVVAHHVTAMSIQAAAARRLLHRDPHKAEDSLKQVESSAREAVADLRTMVLTLRANATDDAALPTLDDLEQLVENAVQQGMPTKLERIGGDPEVTPVAELALYRVAQEALTNSRKHAGPAAEVTVRLRSSRDVVELEVSDNGRATPSSVPGSGAGLVGMRERIAAVGGTLEAGPKPRGGFMVRAAVPTGGNAA